MSTSSDGAKSTNPYNPCNLNISIKGKKLQKSFDSERKNETIKSERDCDSVTFRLILQSSRLPFGEPITDSGIYYWVAFHLHDLAQLTIY